MHILTYGRQHRNICALKMVQREGKKASKKEKIREKIKNITKLSAPHIFYPDIIFSYFISKIRLKIVRKILLNILPKVLGNGNNITVRTHQRHLAARWGNECIIERKKKIHPYLLFLLIVLIATVFFYKKSKIMRTTQKGVYFSVVLGSKNKNS